LGNVLSGFGNLMTLKGNLMLKTHGGIFAKKRIKKNKNMN
jgi:hypothetical protein